MARQAIYLEDEQKRVNKELPSRWNGQAIVMCGGDIYVYSGSSNGTPCFSKRTVIRID